MILRRDACVRTNRSDWWLSFHSNRHVVSRSTIHFFILFGAGRLEWASGRIQLVMFGIFSVLLLYRTFRMFRQRGATPAFGDCSGKHEQALQVSMNSSVLQPWQCGREGLVSERCDAFLGERNRICDGGVTRDCRRGPAAVLRGFVLVA